MTFDDAWTELCKQKPKLANAPKSAKVEITVEEFKKLLRRFHADGAKSNTGDKLFDSLFGRFGK